MSHKFSIGEKAFYNGNGEKIKVEILLPMYLPALRGIDPWYEVYLHGKSQRVHEGALEKIEESRIEAAYKIDDCVYFHPEGNPDKINIGYVLNIREGRFKDTYEYLIRYKDSSPEINEWVKQLWVNCISEEHKAEPKCKIGDRVNFISDLNLATILIGEIEHVGEVDSENSLSPIYMIVTKSGYSFRVAQQNILTGVEDNTDWGADQEFKAELNYKIYESPEFKEGDEAWIKVKIGLWSACKKYIDEEGDIKIHLPGGRVDGDFDWIKPKYLHKSIPPKNDWISVKDRLPEDGSQVHIFTKTNIQQTSFLAVNNKEYIFWVGGLPYHLNKITHWKPLDAPPSE